MKSNAQPSIYFSPHAPKGPNREPSAKPPQQSPYLKAVLSGKTRNAVLSGVPSLADSSLAAALRYIANSRYA